MASNIPDKKKLCCLYFNEDADAGKWKCQCGKVLIQKKGTGWSNLYNHLLKQHKDSVEREIQNQQSSTTKLTQYENFTPYPVKVEKVYGYLEWVCSDLKPFSFVENEFTRKYSKLDVITTKTLKKYMSLTVKKVEEIISNTLPEKFALIIDGWTKSSTHYIGVLASYPDEKNSTCYSTVLLAFSPLVDETDFTADAQLSFVNWILTSVYKKSLQLNVVAIIGDNCETNKRLATLSGKPLIGCASHRFNLAVNHFLKTKGFEDVLEKVNSLMAKLKGLKLSGQLRQLTPLRPIQRNKTRWSSTAMMVRRYEDLKPVISEMEDNPNLIDFILTARENTEISTLSTAFQKLDSVTKALQRESIDLAEVRILFDKTLEYFPSMERYLKNESHIVHSATFERAAQKILDGSENTLTEIEAEAIKMCRLNIDSHPTELTEVTDFASEILKKRKLEKLSSNSIYLNLKFLLPTSNIVERFFSTADFALDNLRQSLNPENLEMQLFLKLNKSFWGKDVVESIIMGSN